MKWWQPACVDLQDWSNCSQVHAGMLLPCILNPINQRADYHHKAQPDKPPGTEYIRLSPCCPCKPDHHRTSATKCNGSKPGTVYVLHMHHAWMDVAPCISHLRQRGGQVSLHLVTWGLVGWRPAWEVWHRLYAYTLYTTWLYIWMSIYDVFGLRLK